MKYPNSTEYIIGSSLNSPRTIENTKRTQDTIKSRLSLMFAFVTFSISLGRKDLSHVLCLKPWRGNYSLPRLRERSFLSFAESI